MKKTFLFAVKSSLPVLFGYVFLGIAFGISLQQAGFGWLWSLCIGTFVYAGSMQFVMIGLLLGGASLLTVAMMTLVINSRHLFYGLSFLTRFPKMGAKYPYMVCALTDETYSLLVACKYPAGVIGQTADFLIALLDHCYWVSGCVLGSLAGQWIPLDFTGIDFSMTALFIVLLIEQCSSRKNLIPAAIGLVCAIAFLLLTGTDNFLIPTLLACTALLCLCRSHICGKEGM